MARTWLAIKAELLGGRGADLWPYPGRLIAVGPSHTFAQLGEAIDVAFARWDQQHLRQFTLADGRIVTDPETAEDLTDSPEGPLGAPMLELDRAKVVRQVEVGEEFSYVFDFGDGWTHCCTVIDRIDPLREWGGSPRRPTPYAGWGGIPDQYGRRWEDDDGDGALPPRPAHPHEMLTGAWPDTKQAPPVDLRTLRGAVARGNVGEIVSAVQGRDVDDVLQHVGSAWELVLEAGHEQGRALAAAVLNRLSDRDATGDAVLSEDLLALLRETPLAVRHLNVELLDVAAELDGPEDQPSGYLDLSTGEVVPHSLTDAAETGEDYAVDIEEDPDRWLLLERQGPRDAWTDMADFVEGLAVSEARRRLEQAIQGRGAFRRFREVVAEEGLEEAWKRHSDDRAMGRARQFLADHGIRVAHGR